MSQTRYGALTKTFHWTTALLVIAMFPLGGITSDLPHETSEQLARKAWLFSIHKTLGVTVFFVALLRILWAFTQPKPGPLHPERKAETMLAEVIHWLLYVCLVAMPLSGWIHHAATSGFAPIWWPFGQGLPLVPKDENVAHIFGAMHGLLAKVMVAAVLLHIAGALKHQFVDKDATLRRMWFGKGEIPATAPHHSSVLPPVVAFAVVFFAGGAGAMMGSGPDHETVASPALAEVASDWQVTEGTLAITVQQLGSAVEGSFDDWTADITYDPDAAPDFGEVNVTIAIGSLKIGSVTDQAMGPDFFAVESFPTATFSGPITVDGESHVVVGELTLKGMTAPVTLPFTLELDGDTARMSGQTTVDRLTFNIGESMADETNLGFPVDIAVDLTATRRSE